MLKESSMASTIILQPWIACGLSLRINGLANASASSTKSAARMASSTRYCSLRCLMELCVRRSKNISELNFCGSLRCFFSRCSQTGSPTAAAPARNQGVKKPIVATPTESLRLCVLCFSAISPETPQSEQASQPPDRRAS